MSDFFITGLPRSRTAWLANFFTCGGSFCFHEAFRFCETVLDYKLLSVRMDYDHVGNSDGGIILIIDKIVEMFPKAKLVMIERDVNESIESTKKVFPHVKNLEGLIERTVELMELAKNKYDIMCIPFDDLNDRIKSVWEYVLPDMPWNADRFELLKEFNVTIQSVNSYYDCLTKNNIVVMEVAKCQ